MTQTQISIWKPQRTQRNTKTLRTLCPLWLEIILIILSILSKKNRHRSSSATGAGARWRAARPRPTAPSRSILLRPATTTRKSPKASQAHRNHSSLVTRHWPACRVTARNQTLVFWRESDVDTGRRSDASLADKDFTIPAADGEYRLVDVMGTPSAIAAACLPGAVRAQAPAVQSSPQRHT